MTSTTGRRGGRELRLDETRYPEAYRRLKDRLLRANAEETMRDQLDIEEEVLEELAQLERDVEARDKRLEVQDKKLEVQEQKLDNLHAMLAEQARMLQELQQALRRH